MLLRSLPVLLVFACWGCDSDGADDKPGATLTSDASTPDSAADVTIVPDATSVPDTVPVDTAGTPGSTAGVFCDLSQSIFNDSPSVNATSTASWTCTATQRVLSANGLPEHDVGTFPNPDCPNTIRAQTVGAQYTLTPAVTAELTTLHVIGYALNGVKFDPGTAGTCNDSGSQCTLANGNGAWNLEALGQSAFDFGDDENHAHVQPNGAYHYHGMPEGLMEGVSDDPALTLVGWAADGFPIYARYGFTIATDASSSVKVLSGSYRAKATPDTDRPSTSLYAMGTFTQDWEYVAGSGDLDECNGRTGVTPEFPGGTYYYAITDSYPYIGRCLKGTAAAQHGPPGGPP